MAMNQPSLDEMLKKVDSRYSLVVITAKRARAITESLTSDDDELNYAKPVTTALKEISASEVKYRRKKQGLK